jgi:hypothetical protein
MMRILVKLLLFVFAFGTACLGQGHPLMSAASALGMFPDAPSPQAIGFSVHRWSETSIPLRSMHTASQVASLAGTRVMLSLLSAVSSKSPVGSSFQARLDSPLAQEGHLMLPQGTVFEGHIHSRPARRMMRPGSMFMTFDRIILPNGTTQRIDLHIVDAATTAVKADSEGRLHPALSKKRLAIQLGGTALTAKFVDDLAELAGGAAVGAGTARLVGAGAAATFFVLQKGREVQLNAGDKLEVEFGRSLEPSLTGDRVPEH